MQGKLILTHTYISLLLLGLASIEPILSPPLLTNNRLIFRHHSFPPFIPFHHPLLHLLLLTPSFHLLCCGVSPPSHFLWLFHLIVIATRSASLLAMVIMSQRPQRAAAVQAIKANAIALAPRRRSDSQASNKTITSPHAIKVEEPRRYAEERRSSPSMDVMMQRSSQSRPT